MIGRDIPLVFYIHLIPIEWTRDLSYVVIWHCLFRFPLDDVAACVYCSFACILDDLSSNANGDLLESSHLMEP